MELLKSTYDDLTEFLQHPDNELAFIVEDGKVYLKFDAVSFEVDKEKGISKITLSLSGKASAVLTNLTAFETYGLELRGIEGKMEIGIS